MYPWLSSILRLFVTLFGGIPSNMVVTAQEAWQKTLDQLQLQMTKATFDTWVKNTHVLKHEDDIYTIGVKSDYAKDWLENRLLGIIKRSLQKAAGNTVHIEFVVRSETDVVEQAEEPQQLKDPLSHHTSANPLLSLSNMQNNGYLNM